jgi:hypothetical protein
MTRPAGALYPFDVSDDVLRISWRAGADAGFYQALEEAYAGKENADARRQAAFFDWPRFRAFFASEAPAELREDPWRVDWKEAAEKTVTFGLRTSCLPCFFTGIVYGVLEKRRKPVQNSDKRDSGRSY